MAVENYNAVKLMENLSDLIKYSLFKKHVKGTFNVDYSMNNLVTHKTKASTNNVYVKIPFYKLKQLFYSDPLMFSQFS